MKNFFKPVALVCSVVLFTACKKEVITPDYDPSPNQQNTRATGALPDDPARIAKVPLIMSAGFLKNSQSLEMVMAANRGRKDGTAPTVTITSPSNGSVVSGTTTIQVSASDNIGVSSVSLTVNGSVVATLTAAPYNFTWNATAGNHTVTATAKDAAGNTAAHSISVSNNTVAADVTSPSVTITSPANGASVSSTITISASGNDNVGVSAVSFQVDGATIATDNSAPYSVSWNTSSVAAGNHTISAIAKDAAGNAGSHSIQVSVNTTVIVQPPTLPSSVILAMPPVANQGVEGSCVTFAVAYAARSCEQYYRSNATSYNFSTNIFSPEYVFNQIQTGCSGSALLDALDLIVSKGVCSWGTMPYGDNGCALQPNASQNEEASYFKIPSYSAVYTSDITAMKTSLLNKHPLMMTFSNDNNFNNAGPGYIWKSYDLSNGVGAHAITICGYDDAKHAFKAINSWGTMWGDGGYIWIDYDFLPEVKSTVYVMN